jgi:hypothetical protein
VRGLAGRVDAGRMAERSCPDGAVDRCAVFFLCVGSGFAGADHAGAAKEGPTTHSNERGFWPIGTGKKS